MIGSKYTAILLKKKKAAYDEVIIKDTTLLPLAYVTLEGFKSTT